MFPSAVTQTGPTESRKPRFNRLRMAQTSRRIFSTCGAKNIRKPIFRMFPVIW